MTALWLRKARLTVGRVAVPFNAADGGLRLVFRCGKNPKATEPNTAQIEAYNLALATRESLTSAVGLDGPQVPGQRMPVILEAGYGTGAHGSMAALFQGHTLSIIHTREGADWVTRILAADGLLTSETPISFSAPAGSTTGQVVQQAARELAKRVTSLDIKALASRAAQGDLAGAGKTLIKALTFSGAGLGQIDRLLKGTGLEISEQDGELVLLAQNETRGLAISLGPDSGLIGTITPVKDDKLPGAHIIKAQSLLRPDIKIGSSVKIDSAVWHGLYKVRRVDHHGDTHGAEWLTEFEGLQI